MGACANAHRTDGSARFATFGDGPLAGGAAVRLRATRWESDRGRRRAGPEEARAVRRGAPPRAERSERRSRWRAPGRGARRRRCLSRARRSRRDREPGSFAPGRPIAPTMRPGRLRVRRAGAPRAGAPRGARAAWSGSRAGPRRAETPLRRARDGFDPGLRSGTAAWPTADRPGRAGPGGSGGGRSSGGEASAPARRPSASQRCTSRIPRWLGAPSGSIRRAPGPPGS